MTRTRIDHATEALRLLDTALADNDRWLQTRRAIRREQVLRATRRPAFEVVAELIITP